MQLMQRTVMGGDAFAEIGRPLKAFWDGGRTRIAITATFLPLWWPARGLHHGETIEYRLALYDPSSTRRLAVLDRPRFPINDVAFHPSLPLLAVATGSYDGGYYYEGALWLWNLATGQATSVLDRSREVTACRFNDSGNALHLTFRPATEEVEATEGPLFLDTTLVGLNWATLGEAAIRVDRLPTTARSAPPYDGPADHAERGATEILLTELARRAGRRYEPRWRAWDVAWAADAALLVVRNRTALEVWSPDGERQLHLPAEADGVQVLPAPTGDTVYANLLPAAPPIGSMELPEKRSRIEHIDWRTGQRRILVELDFPVLLAIDASGRLLARDTETGYGNTKRPSRDYIIATDTTSPPLNLGHFDSINNYLRIDGTWQHYFLQGTPPTSYRRPWVCRLDGVTLTNERLFPLNWMAEQEIHFHSAGGTFVADEGGMALILACDRFQGGGPQQAVQTFVVRRRLDDGQSAWASQFGARVTAMAPILPSWLVLALSDGRLAVLALSTGEVLHEKAVTIDGVPTGVLALAVNGARVAASTLDGRVILYTLDGRAERPLSRHKPTAQAPETSLAHPERSYEPAGAS